MKQKIGKENCITGMNVGLMGKMFGGNIAKVMGGSVSKDEVRILETVVIK